MILNEGHTHKWYYAMATEQTLFVSELLYDLKKQAQNKIQPAMATLTSLWPDWGPLWHGNLDVKWYLYDVKKPL